MIYNAVSDACLIVFTSKLDVKCLEFDEKHVRTSQKIGISCLNFFYMWVPRDNQKIHITLS